MLTKVGIIILILVTNFSITLHIWRLVPQVDPEQACPIPRQNMFHKAFFSQFVTDFMVVKLA